MGIIFIALMFLSLHCIAAAPREFNVLDFGAVADGRTDNSEAFVRAWMATCANHGMVSRMLIPSGKFFLKNISFLGPCNSTIHMQVEGTVMAPPDSAASSNDKSDWISFMHVDQMLLGGRGTFDGQGLSAWKCTLINSCTHSRPPMLSFRYVTNSTVENINLVNAKMFHIHVFSCNNLTFRQIDISSPSDSPNTDGIHIGESQKVKVFNSVIRTGDDCVSIGGGNTGITVSGVVCGPGHGISIGSLGSASRDKDVTEVTVKNSNLTGTTNGVRIKTWEKPYSLSVSEIIFENIIMDRVSNPILIDQHYCPNRDCVRETPSMVKIRNVRFQNIKGTSSSKVAIQLSCSEAEPCENIKLIDINLSYTDKDRNAISSCSNAHGSTSGSVIPASCL